MATYRAYNLGGVNTFVNPLIKNNSDLIRAVNVDSEPFGAKSKRTGYITYLGTADNSQVNTLFDWTKNDGTTQYLYRASGTKLYYSTQGTGAWTVCGNGTITSGGHVAHAVLNNTLMIADGVGSTRYTTTGTSFTNGTLAPVATSLAQYQNRIYAAGTSSTLFYSTTSDATNWNTSGTSDSSSLDIPGAGKLSKIFTVADRLVATKNSGLMYRWDGYSLVDTATRLGPSSPYSVAESEGYYMWVNRLGHFGYGGNKPQLLSNAVQKQFYNNSGSGVVGTTFNTMPATVHRYDYLATLGTVTDDFTGETINNAILKYSFQKNQYLNWQFANVPTAYHSYVDTSGNQQLIFGDSTGQCYKLSGTATTDNGNAIESVMEFVIHLDQPDINKKWNRFTGFFNPGCQAQVQIAMGDTYVASRKKWTDLGDVKTGVVQYKFPLGSRSKLLFLKIYEASKNVGFNFYGYAIDADFEPLR